MQWHYCGVTRVGQIPFAWSRVAPVRWRGALAVLGLVLLLHGLLLGLVPRAPGTGWQAQAPRWVQVRRVVEAVAVPAAVAPPEAAGAMAPQTAAARPAVTPIGQPAAIAPVAAATLPAPAAAERVSEPTDPTPDPGGQAVPVYATQRPPPVALQFEMRRGLSVGQAVLDWHPSADGYQLTLQGRATGAPAIGWASVGGFDSDGIAPLRYTESRRGRELRAANFQRDSGRLTFSGPAIEHPLVRGAQDRLSWMVQLAAVLAANPALGAPEAQVSMWVAGARGDAEVWTFTVQGRVALDLAAGRVDDALHLVREPRRPYDTQVQVWLDPQRHHLPVQVLLRVRATGDGTELRLQAFTPR